MSLLPATLMWTLLATVLAHSHLAYPERNLRSTTTIPDFYHKPDVIIREMQQMCHIHEHMRCEENRNIPYVIVEGVDTSVHDILFAGMHARELSASETALALIRRFSDPNDKPPHNLIIIPIQNKWGMDKVWGGDFAHRKNIHGGKLICPITPSILNLLNTNTDTLFVVSYACCEQKLTSTGRELRTDPKNVSMNIHFRDRMIHIEKPNRCEAKARCPNQSQRCCSMCSTSLLPSVPA